MGNEQKTNTRNIDIKYPFSLVLSLITILGVYSIWGIYWEESMKMHPQVIYGFISEPPYEAWFNESFLLQAPILAFLSTRFEQIPVHGIWHLLILTLYTSIWFFMIIRMLARYFDESNLIVLAISHLVVWSLLGSSIFYLHLSREAIFLMAGSLLLFFDYYFFENKKPKGLIFTFLLGCLMRVSLSIFVLSIALFLISLILNSFQRALQLYKFQITISAICIFLVLGNKLFSGNQGVLIEQNYEYALIDGNAKLPLSKMKTTEDSIKYVAFTDFFLITDSCKINLPFMRSIFDYQMLLNFGINRDDFLRFSRSLTPLLKKQALVLSLFYFLLFLASWQSDKKTKFNLLVFNLLGWFVVFGISIKLGMYNRFLLPWIATLIAGSALLIIVRGILLNKQIKITIGIILLLNTLLVVSDVSCYSKEEKEYNIHAKSYLKNLETLSKTSVPIIWDYSQLFFPTEILSRNESAVFKKCIYQTLFFVSYYKFGQERCIQKFGFSPLDWKSMGNVLNKNSDKVSFVMNENLANFLTPYFKIMYNIDFVLVKDFPLNEVCPGNFAFHLKPE